MSTANVTSAMITGLLFWLIDLTSRNPTPLYWNRVSVMSAPPMRMPMLMPT